MAASDLKFIFLWTNTVLKSIENPNLLTFLVKKENIKVGFFFRNFKAAGKPKIEIINVWKRLILIKFVSLRMI